MSCRWVSHGEPRMLRSHLRDCDTALCDGCEPCRVPHCRVCGLTHVDHACAECVGLTRESLHEIGTMCGALPTEVAHRGINGEAMVLTGPAADVEARQFVEASYLAGRLPEGWIEASHGRQCPRFYNEACVGCSVDKAGNLIAATHELHPLAVLGTWEMVWRDYLEHETDEVTTIEGAVRYLDLQLTYMATQAMVPFGDFANDLKRCANHLRAVLHDQNHGDMANVGCFECGADLERLLTTTGLDDVWTCSRCRRKYTLAEYNFALRAALEANAQGAPA